MIRVIALDLDDTLLRSDGTISSDTLSSLRRWTQAGHRVVVATGRPPRSIAGSLPDELQTVPWVCYNGAEIRHNGETVYANLIPTTEVREIVAMGQQQLPDWRIGVEINDTLYMNKQLEVVKQYTYIPDLLDIATEPAAKVIFTTSSWLEEQSHHIDEFLPLEPLLAALPAGTRPILSHRYRLAQLLSSSADKAVALQHLVEGWGLSMANVMAFGDDVNDVGMLRASAVGVAVRNAVDEVHAAADRVTGSNDEEGVATLVNEYLDAGR
jgi:Cof subfamily protein (haloacid dehalogenase superfamily)